MATVERARSFEAQPSSCTVWFARPAREGGHLAKTDMIMFRYYGDVPKPPTAWPEQRVAAHATRTSMGGATGNRTVHQRNRVTACTADQGGAHILADRYGSAFVLRRLRREAGGALLFLRHILKHIMMRLMRRQSCRTQGALGFERCEGGGTCSQSFKQCCGGLLGEKKHVACAPRATTAVCTMYIARRERCAGGGCTLDNEVARLNCPRQLSSLKDGTTGDAGRFAEFN